MTRPDPDHLDSVARYLADGDTEAMVDTPRRELDRLRHLLADESTWLQPPSELADKVVARVGAEPPEAVARRSLDRRRPFPVRRVALGGIAAAVALVVGGLVVADRLEKNESNDGTIQVALSGTELAPAASARAELEDTPTGVAITLDVEGLPPTPDGFYYQAWVKGPRGLVTIGTFHMRGDDEPVVLWSGVDTADYPEITVTLEPEDGDPASSGQLVLSGTLP